MTSKVSRKVRLGEVTAGEAREILARNPVILLPLGSHEDQGPHAPMGDYLLAEHVAAQIADRACAWGVETLVAPVIPFGGANFFPGREDAKQYREEPLAAVTFCRELRASNDTSTFHHHIEGR